MFCRLNLVVMLLLALLTHGAVVPSFKHARFGLQPRAAAPPEVLSTKPLHTRYSFMFSEVHQLPSGWSLHVKHYSILMPVTTVAAILTNFYENVMSLAAHAADTFEEEHTDMAIQIGELLLRLATNEELIPVSWDLVHDFAKMMKSITERGLVGGLEAVLKCGSTEVMILVEAAG
ncbi:hypothetical protein G7Y79_00053g088040 [Physcia stellaris]|nr:hypothetical protein G7Y79_00053g088040 [Physcia stellaris]